MLRPFMVLFLSLHWVEFGRTADDLARLAHINMFSHSSLCLGLPQQPRHTSTQPRVPSRGGPERKPLLPNERTATERTLHSGHTLDMRRSRLKL